MSDWTIKGQAAKSLDDTVVDLEVTNYSGVKITRTNQGTDTLSFFLSCEDATTDPDYLPEYQQEISIFRGGVRQFIGYVGKPKFAWRGGIFGWQVEAQNGILELDRVALSTSNAEYTRAQGSLASTVSDVVTKAIAAGARISLGSVAAMFDIPAITFRGTSCGAALIELLRICADAVAYFDYSGAGNPALVIARRGSMTAKTITFGTDEIVQPFSCSPIPGATPTKITVAYATRDANGVVTETIQSSGIGTDVQSVILTGSNFADFQTRATAEQIAMRTTTTPNWDFAWAVYKRDPKLANISGIPTPWVGNTAYIDGPTSGDKGGVVLPGDNAQFVGITAPNSYVLAKGKITDYMTSKLGFTQGVCGFTADFTWIWRKTILGALQPKPDWLEALIAAGAQIVATGWFNSTDTFGPYYAPHPDYDTTEVWRYRATFDCVTISRNFNASDTNVRDPGDYGPTPPPGTLAADLLAAQSFIPYEGEFNLSPWHTPELLLNKKINFAGLSTRLASIGALVQSETVDVETGAVQATMGLAARQGAVSLARLRRLSSSV